MIAVDLDGYSYLRFDLAKAPAEGNGGAIPLTPSDINGLPGTASSIDALFDFLSKDFDMHPMLVGAEIHIVLVPASSDVIDSLFSRERCDEFVDVLEKAADQLRENAQLLKPMPPSSVVAVKASVPLFKALAAANEISPLHIELVHPDGEKRAIPIPQTAELPTVRAREQDILNVTSKVIGLIRGNEGLPHELIIEGGTRVVLPDRSPWTWNDIHFFLETPNWLEGTLARVPRSNKWTIGADIKVTPQLTLELARPSTQADSPAPVDGRQNHVNGPACAAAFAP